LLARDLVARSARAYGDGVAYIDGGRRLTWRELDRRSDRLAAGLQSLGIGKGDVVALLAHDRLELVEHWWACVKIGALRTGVNYRYAPREIAHIVRDCDARAVVVDAALIPLVADEVSAFEAEGRRLIGIGEAHGLALDYEELLAAGGEPVLPPLGDDDPLAISYTSGTTGLPKGALFTQRGVREALIWMNINVGLRHEDVWVNGLPCAGAAMIFTAANAVNGMTCVMVDGGFRPDRFLELTAEHRVTSTILVPTMITALLERLDRVPADTSSLRLLCYGSMPASPALIRATKQRFGCEVQQWYSATELTAAPAVILRDAAHRHAIEREPELLTSCGAASALVDLEIRSPQGEPLAVGEVGEVWVRGDVVFGGYLNRADETAEVLSGGWLRPGDLGRMDDRGNLYLVDRKRFMIISGGYNVYPVVVENVMAEHPAVREVAAVGAPHPRWGEAVVAVVSLHAGAEATPTELIAFCEDQVAKWEVPKHVEIVDELPKGATAKIQKHEIRDWFRSDPTRLPWSGEPAA
jgi:acyl-CoA synthetase (AMP-forming)/AMP-acid ligase II